MMQPTIEQAVGQNVASFRKRKGWNQAELGKALEDALGKPWQRQSVWAAENGKRSFSSVDLIGLASALGVTVQELLAVDEAVIAGSKTLSPDQVLALTAGDADTRLYYRIFHTAGDVKNSMRLSESLYWDLIRDVRRAASVNGELREEIAQYRDAQTQKALKDLRKDYAGDGRDEPTGAALKAALEAYVTPAIETARDALEGVDDGEGN